MDHLYKELNKLKGKKRVEKIRELEDLFGTKEMSSFGTYDTDIFEENLKEMDLHGMRKLASKVGINPYQEKPQLKDALRRAFETEAKDKRGFIVSPPQDSVKINPRTKKGKEALRILNDW